MHQHSTTTCYELWNEINSDYLIIRINSTQLLQINSSPPVLHIFIRELGQPWFRWWLNACSAPSHYLDQCWLIVNWPLRKHPEGEIWIKIQNFHSWKCIWKCCLQKCQPFFQGKWVKANAICTDTFVVESPVDIETSITTSTSMNNPEILNLVMMKLFQETWKCTWVRSWNCGCFVTWFCYQLIAKPGNKTAAVPWRHTLAFLIIS